MRILLVNDDGLACEGILALVRALHGRHQLTVIAPESERSGFSHSLTIHGTIDVKEARIEGYEDVAAYTISGTPADCAKLGIRALCKEPPQLVVSGINNGSNLGSDVCYSGTCGAAMEAAMLGYPAVAVSQFYDEEEGTVEFATAAGLFAALVDSLAEWTWPAGVMLNINYPAFWETPLKGTRVTTLCRLDYEESYDVVGEKRDGTRVYKLRGILHGGDPEDADLGLIRQGYITITPIEALHAL